MFERVKVMIAMALILVCWGWFSSGLCKKESFASVFSATTALSSTMIQLNRTTIWKNFPQYISKYMALKIWSLKYFEQCSTGPDPVSLNYWSMYIRIESGLAEQYASPWLIQSASVAYRTIYAVVHYNMRFWWNNKAGCPQGRYIDIGSLASFLVKALV